MALVSYETAKDIGDRFLDLLHKRQISRPNQSAAQTQLLSLTDLLDIWRDPARIRNSRNEAETIRSAAAVHDLSAKVLCSETLPDFASFEKHLKLIAESEEFTTIGQIAPANARDDISRKMAELYVGCLAIHCGEHVVLDDPVNAKGNNPDIMLTYNNQRWALAVKTLVSDRNGQTIFENIKSAAKQIDASSADKGLVIINAKNVIDHGSMCCPAKPFANENDAVGALSAELNRIADLADKNRPDSDWDEVFSGKAVPSVIFMGQTIVYLPVGGVLRHQRR